jgi:hypothetical protein
LENKYSFTIFSFALFYLIKEIFKVILLNLKIYLCGEQLFCLVF